jgi:2'-5' RNA ligase
VEPYCGLVLPLDRLEGVIGAAGAGRVPAHVTLAHPLPAIDDPGEILDRLRGIFEREAAFDLTLEGFGRFPAVGALYLQPEPTGALLRMADAAFAACPGAAPEFPEHIFHATLAQGVEDLEAAEQRMSAALAGRLPLVERIERAELYRRSRDGWRLQTIFRLRS